MITGINYFIIVNLLRKLFAVAQGDLCDLR